MKKNVMMRLASFLLVAVLISTSAISGTYAKYVTEANAKDNARVAKWGVVIETAGDMFSDSYKDLKTDYIADEEKAEITVQADTEGTNVVAPGTKGTLASFNVTGTPEVDVEVTYKADLTLEGWKVDGNEYCPIIFTVGTNTYKIGDAGIAYVSDLVKAVEDAIVDAYAYYHTNTNLAEVSDDLIVSWEWPYYVDEATDVKDTALGDAAAAGNAATIALDVTITVTQVD